MNSDELMYLWLCKINNRNVMASKQSKLCFSTIHTSRLHVSLQQIYLVIVILVKV